MLEVLAGALGVKGRRERLRRYVTWSADDAQQFDRALELQRQVDEASWR